MLFVTCVPRIRREARAAVVAVLLAGAVLVPFVGTAPAQAREIALDGQEATAVAPSQQLARVEPSSRGARATPDISAPDKFIAAVAEPARESQRQSGVPAAVTIAQAILESEWGRSGLSTKAQNYFGIKAASGAGPAGVVNMDTWEVFAGQNTVVRDGFKAYHNLEESVMDHGRFLKENPRYASAFGTEDPKEFAHRIHLSGYATDPDYCGKLSSLIDKYHLEQFDLKPGAK